MKAYNNFKIAAYVFAYYLKNASDEDIKRGIEFYSQYIHLDKVYIENHRGEVDITPKRLREVKAIFEEYGIKTAGGITSTQHIGKERKPAYFDVFCYTDPEHRKEYRRIVSELAGVFDEIILDDFFFTSCRCELCIEAKGKLSWAEYRLKLLEDFSHEIVDLAKSINPGLNFIIKYPNWFESFQETGYNPSKQKDIFDMVYTGTETRDAIYSAQHLQRYESYSLIRLLENTAPDRNGGGWIDLGGASPNLNFYLEQADLTLFAKAKELMLFNFSSMIGSNALPALGNELKRVDKLVGKMGSPTGTWVWEPYDGDGEDQVFNYLGMCGLALEPSPYMNMDAPAVLFTQSTAIAPDAMEKLEEYVRKGGHAIVTTGFFKAMYDKGIKDLTSVRLTGRHVIGHEYMIDHSNYTDTHFTCGRDDVLFEILNYKTNATVSDVSLISGENNFPILTEDNYAKGRFFILNLPENFADLYKLPLEVIRGINKQLSIGQRVYLGNAPKFNLFMYDNNVYGIHSFRPMTDTVQVIVRGKCKGLRDIETGRVYEEFLTMPKPNHRGDATTVYEEPTEYAFNVNIGAGRYMFFEIIE
ncbi:MAG: hypothetical protein IJB92_03405 [Clostridia bacterium]|nr:hypothetical protein [Clostridia bacterium]